MPSIDWEAKARGLTSENEDDANSPVNWEAKARGIAQSTPNVVQNSAPAIPKSVDFSTGEMISNIPSSAGKFATDMAQPFIHPVDTGKAVGNLALGASEKIENTFLDYLPDSVKDLGNKASQSLRDIGIPVRENPYTSGKTGEHEKYVNQVGNFIKDRYGTTDRFKQTVMDDPVGALADFATVLTGGGAAAAKLPGVAGKAGKVMKTAGMTAEPINLISGGAKYAAAKAIPNTMPGRLYESAAKFSTTMPKSERALLANTALNNKIMPSSSGVDRLNGVMSGLSAKIDSMVDGATKAGEMIPKKALFAHMQEARKKLGGAKIEGSRNLSQIDKVAKNLDEHLKNINKDYLTPNEVHALKKDAYKEINFDKKTSQSQIGRDEGRKSVARAAKDSIEKITDVKDLNKELGKLLKLKDPLQRSAGRIENRDIIGIGAPIKISAGTAAAGPAGMAATTALSILEMPKVKAKLGIKIMEIQKAGKLNLINHNLLPSLVRLGLLQAGRLEELPPGDIERE